MADTPANDKINCLLSLASAGRAYERYSGVAPDYKALMEAIIAFHAAGETNG